MKIKCNKCGKKFKNGNTNGLPNGLGFQLHSGEVLNLCRDCIIELGTIKNEKKRDEFFNAIR